MCHQDRCSQGWLPTTKGDCFGRPPSVPQGVRQMPGDGGAKETILTPQHSAAPLRIFSSGAKDLERAQPVLSHPTSCTGWSLAVWAYMPPFPTSEGMPIPWKQMQKPDLEEVPKSCGLVEKRWTAALSGLSWFQIGHGDEVRRSCILRSSAAPKKLRSSLYCS